MAKSKVTNLDTIPKLLAASAVSLLLSYVFVSLALDTARYWQYLLAIIFLVFGIKFLISSFKTHGNK